MYEYFYGEQSNQFSFYRIPKILFTDEAFKSISPEAKILYGILLDRMNPVTEKRLDRRLRQSVYSFYR